MTINTRGTKIWFKVAKYGANDNLAIQAWCSEGPYATMTVNLGEKLAEDEAYVDLNNWPDAAEIIDLYELGKCVGAGTSGFCIYPKVKFNLDKLRRYDG